MGPNEEAMLMPDATATAPEGQTGDNNHLSTRGWHQREFPRIHLATIPAQWAMCGASPVPRPAKGTGLVGYKRDGDSIA